MATPGRKPKPTHLKVLAGNPGKRPLPANEPKPKPVAPDPPAWLDREARALWKEIGPELERLGLLTAVDGPAFAMLLTHYVLAVKAARRIKKDGILSVDEQGVTRKHPASQIVRDHSAAFRQYVAEFGLSPAARARLSLPDEKDDGDDFFGG